MSREPEVSSVTPGHGLAWITGGWSLFARAPGTWIGIIVVVLLIYMGCNLVPMLGSLLSPFVQTLLAAGMLLAARNLQTEGAMGVGDLFDVFSHPALKPLMILSGIYLLLMLGAVAVLILFGLGSGALAVLSGVIGGDSSALATGAGGILIGLLVFLGLMAPILAMYWFAVPLVLLGGMHPWDAMVQSLVACLANIVPLLVYGLVATVILIVASIPLMLGLLVAAPLLVASWLISYQDIFESRLE